VMYFPFEHWQFLGSNSRKTGHDLQTAWKLRIDSGDNSHDTCYGRVTALSTNTNMIYEWKLQLNLSNNLSNRSKHNFCVGIAAECEPNQALWQTANNLRDGSYWREVKAANVLTVQLRFYERGRSPTLSFYSKQQPSISGFSHIEVDSRLKYRLAVSLPRNTHIKIRSFKITAMNVTRPHFG